MPYQPNLFSQDRDEAPATAGSKASTRQQQPNWLARTELLVRVLVRLYVGLLIIALPWLRFWNDNGILHASHGLWLLAGSGVLRGMVSGLGILNVGIALDELFARRPER